MVPREHKRAALHDKLQLLRSITHSQASSSTSIIMDASQYIQELKKKVERLNREIACTQNTIGEEDGDSRALLPRVTVETLQKGYLINVSSGKSYPGLLVSILEAFEQLGLSIAQARATCSHSFRLEAVGEDFTVAAVDAQVVKEAVLRAVKTCSGSIGRE